MNILAIDAATHTGWCLLGSNLMESGTEDFSKQRGESNGTMFLRFRHWLNKILIENKVNLVIYEQAHHRGGAATEIGVNLTGRIQECCAELGIEHATIHTSTLKKYATGSGKADKADMVKAACKLTGKIITSDDEADAVLMAKWGVENYA